MGFEHIEKAHSCCRFYPLIPFPWETTSIWQTPSLDSQTTGGTVFGFLHPVIGESQGATRTHPPSHMHKHTVSSRLWNALCACLTSLNWNTMLQSLYTLPYFYLNFIKKPAFDCAFVKLIQLTLILRLLTNKWNVSSFFFKSSQISFAFMFKLKNNTLRCRTMYYVTDNSVSSCMYLFGAWQMWSRNKSA